MAYSIFTLITPIEKALANLGEGFTIDDDICCKLNDLKTWLRDRGIDPYGLPSSDRTNSFK